MLHVTVFVAAFLVTLSVLVLVSALFMVTFQFSDRYAQGILINNLVNTSNNLVNVLAAMPGAMLTYASNHVAATILFGTCIFLHVELDYNEAKFLQESQTVYYDMHQIWVQGIVVPLGAVAGALYASWVPIYNYFVYVPTTALFGTLKVLCECGNPMVLFTAAGQAFVAVSQMFQALATALGSPDGSWLSARLSLDGALMHLQTHTIQPVVNEVDCLCEFIAPTIRLASNAITTPHLAMAISAAANTLWRAWQVPAQLASERFGNHFNATPAFDEMRDACYHAGMLGDVLLETTVNWVQLQTTLGSTMVIPKPSLGTGIARQVAAFLSVPEVAISGFAALVGVGGQSLWDALSFRTVATQAHLGVLEIAVGVNTVQKLLTGQGVPTDDERSLKCEYYDYDFFADYNVYGSIAQECMCVEGVACGAGVCGSDRMSCQCDASAVPLNATDPMSPCVESCTSRARSQPCGPADFDATQFYGTCTASTGLCDCSGSSSYPQWDPRTNVCVEAQRPVPQVPGGVCGGTGRRTAQTGPPVPCIVQSAGLAAVGIVYTGASLLRLLAVDIVSSRGAVMPWTMMQTVDGMWYPRMNSVTCESRRFDAAMDPTIDPANCKCSIDPDDIQGRHFDPYCAQPTLNANVYTHLDSLAYYAGYKLPFEVKGYTLLSGGMGFYETFLNDNVGVFATNVARTIVEGARVASRLASAVVTYAMTALDDSNWLALPINCGEWGSEYGWMGTHVQGDAYWGYNATYEECGQAAEYVANYSTLKASTAGLHDKWPAEADAVTCVAPRQGVHQRQPVPAMNRARLLYRSLLRHNQVQGSNCASRAYKVGAAECAAPKSNSDPSCICSIELPYDPATDQCQAIAWYPGLDVQEEDLHGYFNNSKMSGFYHQDMPWCNSMMLEWLYYRGMEAAVAVNNFFARLDSSDLLHYQFDSPCYEDDPSNQYTIGDTTSVVKIFQRPASGATNTYRTLTGTAPRSINNETICATLQNGGTSYGQAFSPANPRWIKFDPTTGFPCPDCWSSSDSSTTGNRTFWKPGGGDDDEADFQNPALPPPLTPDTVDKPGLAQRWVDFAMHNASQSDGPGTYSYHVNDMSTIYQLTDRAYMLHPETCASVRASENMIFQPCMHTCRTTFGIDRCWCNVTVPTDFVCNVGQVLRQASWGVVSHARRATTAVISLLGAMPGGAVYNVPSGYCDLSRVIGTACGAVASLLTAQKRSAAFAEARRRLASLLFAVADTAFIMPLSMLGDKAQKIAAKMKLQQAAQLNMYENLFEDLIEPGSGGGSVAGDESNVLGEAVANYMWGSVKFQCVLTCNIMDGLQKVIFGTSTTSSASQLIPAVEDFVDLVIQLLDEAFTEIITAAVSVMTGFWGLMIHDNPTVGEWALGAINLVLKAFAMIDKYEKTFFSLVINMLPKSVQTIVKLLMEGMCVLTQETGSLIVGSVNDLIKAACLFTCGGPITNHFSTNLDECNEFGNHNIPVDLNNIKPNDESYGRRRLASYPELYAQYRELLDWNGTTVCARYGRHDEPPENEDLWRVCVGRRQTIAHIRQTLERDYVPWTLLDDWTEPVGFALKVAHGAAIDIVAGRETLLKWQQAMYPVQASIDVVDWVKSWAFPTWDGAAHGLAGAIPVLSPDYKTNKRSLGYNAMRILAAARSKPFPNLLALPWGAFHREARRSFHNLTSSIQWPLPPASRPPPAPRPPPPPRRRLVENAAPPLSAVVAPAEPSASCSADEQPVCTKCRVLDVFINDIVNISNATYDYYNNAAYGYLAQIDYALHAASMYHAIAKANNNSIESFGKPGTNWQYPVSPSTTFMDQARPKRRLNVPIDTRSLTKDAVIQFFKTTSDAPVPFFNHGLWWYLKYPLRSCDATQMAYHNCHQPEYSMEDSLVLTLYIFVVLVAWGWLTGLAVPWVLMAPLLFFVFLLFRYDYVPRCMPVLPVCLVSDIQYMLSDSKPCLCEVVPALVVRPELCVPGSCTYSNQYVTYRSCPRDELGIFDSTVLVMRWQMPEIFQLLFAHDYSPLGTLRNYYPVIKQYTADISDGVDMTELQKTCAKLGMFDIITVVIAVHILATAAVPVGKAALDTAISAAAAISEGSSQLASVHDHITKRYK